MITSDQIKDVNQRIELLHGYLEIDKKLIQISNEEEKASDPDFWNNPKEAEVLMRRLRGKKKWVTEYNELKADGEDLLVMYDFFKEEEASEQELQAAFDKTFDKLEALEFRNMLS
ncbi:MAG: PCRF domain-containing protein, partial [Lutimonas sp.]